MALLTPNFDECQESVSPGTYKVRVKNSEVKTSQGGSTYVRWTLETFGSDEQKNNGRYIFTNTMITGPGAFTLRDLYRAAVGQALTGQFDTEQLVGKEIAVDVVDGVAKDGQPTGYPEVKKFRALQS